jgi:tripartite-type tricarboxylate transporter receptor subunit TctC
MFFRALFVKILIIIQSLFLIQISNLHAQSYPNKSIHITIGFPPGGAIDTIMRVMAPKMSKQLGQSVVVENKAGAGGIIGMQYVARTEADGYNLFMGTMGNFSITPALVKDLPYQVYKDFQPITQVAASPFIIFINPQLPVKNLAELIAYAKANPKNVYFSSSGNAGLPHMAGEMFNQATGTQMIHVPYKGSAPSITDLMGGQVQLTFEAIAIGLPHLKSGRLKALATTDNKRLTILPDLPAAAETVPGYVVKNWFGLAAPSGIPMDRVLLIQKVVSLVLQDPEVLKTLVDLGVEPIGDSPNQFGALVRQETERWQKLLQNSGIKSD